MNNPLYDNLSDDLLQGADEIAAFIGCNRRRAFYLAERGLVPIIRIGKRLTARKSTIRRYIADLEKAAKRKGVSDGGAT